MVSILWLITILLVVLWVLGFAINIGSWINFLIIAAVILLIFNLISAFTSRGATHAHDVHDDDVHHHYD